MARTSRPAASNNVAALDNIDLDDMFNEDADDLFEGLIDMDNMDDEMDSPAAPPAAGPQHHKASASSASSTNKKSKSNRLPSSTAAPEAPVPATSIPGASVATGRSRRKTKRKVMDEDDDDSYEEPAPSKKRKRPTKKKAQPKKSSDTPPPPTSILPSLPKHKPTTTTSATLPKTTLMKTGGPAHKATGIPTQPPIPNNGHTLKRKAPPRSSLMTTEYCGLSPSNTVFYPFLDLPNEFLLKSKKPFQTIDKLHTAFQSQLQQQQQQQASGTAPNPPRPENDPIVRLLQDGKLDASTVARAVAAMRANITPTSTSLADWCNVAKVLQRQHDFLNQSAANMQAWCRNNFNDEEYADVYSDILRTFQTPNIKVKVLVGKDKNKTLLPAILPPYIVRRTTTTTTTTTTHRPTPTTKASRPKPAPAVPPPPTPYAHLCSAAARRKAIADRLSQVAPTAAVTAVTLPPRPLLPSMPTTMSMWKWLEQSGYWGMGEAAAKAARVEPWKLPESTDPSVLSWMGVEDRVMSLLVDVEDGDDDDCSAVEEEEDICMESSDDCWDASVVPLDDRYRWLLQRAGWGEYRGSQPPEQKETCEVEETIDAMISDLHGTDELNNNRLDYLESVRPLSDEQKKLRQEQAALISKCQQLLKKSKEKAKQTVTKRDDDIKLPW